MRITHEMSEQIITWREGGQGYDAIARRLLISAGAVGYHCLKNAVDPPNPPPPAKRRDGPIMRRSGLVHPFTADDDALINALAVQSVSHVAIARQLTRRDPARPRRPHSIKCRLMTLARQQARAEEVESNRERKDAS